ncbi:MAG: NAD(P)H-dependent oxidoreductase [Lachnospiraceae bacterium]|nr:NAD(P)H-dependent oxidoreductase [Lachnospiraceae bacterium]
MKITVINGTEKHGVTYRLKEIFLEQFREKSDIREFYLPKDCPAFCSGCANCVIKGEHICKDAEYIKKITSSLLESDLIVMTSPVYVMHATGSMKALLDHLAYLWMPHRPAPEMFTKRAVIITQCLGAGAKSAAKDIKHSLSWWGISRITVFTGKLMGDIVWEGLSEKKRLELTKKINHLSDRFFHINYEKPSRVNAITRIKFLFCRKLQKALHESDPDYLDGKYWAKMGWLGKARPWRA